MEYTSCGRTCYTRTFKMKLKGQSHSSFTIQKKKKKFYNSDQHYVLKTKNTEGKKIKNKILKGVVQWEYESQMFGIQIIKKRLDAKWSGF